MGFRNSRERRGLYLKNKNSFEGAGTRATSVLLNLPMPLFHMSGLHSPSRAPCGHFDGIREESASPKGPSKREIYSVHKGRVFLVFFLQTSGDSAWNAGDEIALIK